LKIFLDEATKISLTDGSIIFDDKNFIFVAEVENKVFIFGRDQKAQKSFLSENEDKIRKFLNDENWKTVFIEEPASLSTSEPKNKKLKVGKKSSTQIDVLSTIDEVSKRSEKDHHIQTRVNLNFFRQTTLIHLGFFHL